MDLRFAAADEAYRERLRAWLAENLGVMQAADLGSVAKAGGRIMDVIRAARAWQRHLYEAGYVGLAWPTECGGHEATLTEQVIVAEELARAQAPLLINTIGLTILGPTLVRHGTDEQRRRFLPRILTAEDLWCQGFSEPGAGSDLGALATRAEADGDSFVVNGQKVWTSMGPVADWCFLLVRTDPAAPRRDGISYLLCDMATPGIDVRPLRNAGGGIHFSELFLTDVRVPRRNLVGDLNGGWAIARTTLAHERSGLSTVASLEEHLGRLRGAVSGLPAAADPSVRRALAQRWIEVEGLRYLGYRALSEQLAGREPGAEAAVGKLFATETRGRIMRTALDAEGPLAQVAKRSPHAVERGRWQALYFDALGYAIGGGTSEIMRNVIAERVLGLPRGGDSVPPTTPPSPDRVPQEAGPGGQSPPSRGAPSSPFPDRPAEG